MDNKKAIPYVKIIGCGDAFASGGRFNTCFYMFDESHHFLIDCGASSLVALKKQKVPLSKIETIILSHLHGDHFGGIPFLLLDAQYNQKRTEPLVIAGPSETENKVKALTEILYPGTIIEELNFKVRFIEYEANKSITIGPVSLIAYKVMHSEPSHPHGLRISFREKVFSFSGDTEWTDALIDLSKDADLFICESNYYDKKGPNHLDYKTLINYRNKLSCKKMLLNHLGEEMLASKNDLEIDCAEDGLIINL